MELKSRLFLLSSFVLGMIFYLFAVFSSFNVQDYNFTLHIFLLFAYTFLGGIGVLTIGYLCTVMIGGAFSLRFFDFRSHLNRSEHFVELKEEQRNNDGKFILTDLITYMPILVFILSLVLAWDIHNLHDPRTSIFYPVFHELDIFSKPIIADQIFHLTEMIPSMIILITIAGIFPSAVLPYFRKFKITSINSAPFHLDLLFTVSGFIVGLGAFFTVVGLIFQVMWFGKGPYYYHFIIPSMIGLSIHYSIGIFLGRERSENLVKKNIVSGKARRIVVGKVNA